MAVTVKRTLLSVKINSLPVMSSSAIIECAFRWDFVKIGIASLSHYRTRSQKIRQFSVTSIYSDNKNNLQHIRQIKKCHQCRRIQGALTLGASVVCESVLCEGGGVGLRFTEREIQLLRQHQLTGGFAQVLEPYRLGYQNQQHHPKITHIAKSS